MFLLLPCFLFVDPLFTCCCIQTRLWFLVRFLPQRDQLNALSAFSIYQRVVFQRLIVILSCTSKLFQVLSDPWQVQRLFNQILLLFTNASFKTDAADTGPSLLARFVLFDPVSLSSDLHPYDNTCLTEDSATAVISGVSAWSNIILSALKSASVHSHITRQPQNAHCSVVWTAGPHLPGCNPAHSEQLDGDVQIVTPECQVVLVQEVSECARELAPGGVVLRVVQDHPPDVEPSRDLRKVTEETRVVLLQGLECCGLVWYIWRSAQVTVSCGCAGTFSVESDIQNSE